MRIDSCELMAESVRHMIEGNSVIPRPARMEARAGGFLLAADSRIRWSGPSAEGVAELLADYLRPATGYRLPVARSAEADSGDILLVQTGTDHPDEAGFLPEAYICDVSPTSVRIEAPSGAGLARAVQTLRQLLPSAIYAAEEQQAQWRISCVRIDDEPRFRWRGMHLDVSRYFRPVADVCRFIELLAMHRYNICHLHLTDDQGWRIQIKQYPRLTEIGAVRPRTLIGHERDRPRRYDDRPYGGFYTQDDIRAIVAFAARRYITLVPEIEMPGHSQAAIAAYPELGNTGQRLEPRCHWGISRHVLNVEDATIAFMRNVLDEVIDLFPGRFIHIGGDEAPKHEWSESRAAQQRMAALGLADENQLQSWFIQRMDRHVVSRGRRLIGWDEILEGGLAEGAAVMSWRGENGGMAAARQGHDAVMTPKEHVYFDYYQAEPTVDEPLAIGGMVPIERVYAYEPVPPELPADARRHILGAQAQLWSEYMPSLAHLEYMAYPRACALAETLWLPPQDKCQADFLNRLRHHRQRLAALNVNAHPRP